MISSLKKIDLIQYEIEIEIYSKDKNIKCSHNNVKQCVIREWSPPAAYKNFSENVTTSSFPRTFAILKLSGHFPYLYALNSITASDYHVFRR